MQAENVFLSHTHSFSWLPAVVFQCAEVISCSFSPVGFKGTFDFHTGHRVGAFFGLSVNPAKGGGFPFGFKTFHGSDGVGFFFSSFPWQQFSHRNELGVFLACLECKPSKRSRFAFAFVAITEGARLILLAAHSKSAPKYIKGHGQPASWL